MAGENGHKLNTGLSVEIEVTSDIDTGELAYVNGFLGFNVRAIESGESGVLDIEPAQWDVILPTALNLSKGNLIYVDVTDLTGHIPDDSAFSTTSGGSKVKWAKAMTDQDDTTGQVRILQLPPQG